MWAGHPDGFLQVNPMWAGHPDGFLQVNTLALRGLEEPFFQLCCCVSFGSGGKKVLAVHTTSLGDIYSSDFVLYVLYVETVPVPQTPLANKLFVNTRCQPWRPAAWPVPLPVA